MKPLTVLTVKATTTKGKYQYNLMGADDTITHIHINEVEDLDSNGKNKNRKNSVMVPISDLQELFHDNSL